MPTKTSVKIGKHVLTLSNLEKVLYPSGFTKAQVVDYYVRIAPAMLPHLKDRAATFKRYPNGTTGKFFFEKNCPSHKPDWVDTALIASREGDGAVNHCVLNDVASLAWAANLAALEIHVPLARARQPDRPTAMVFDLDPGPGNALLECLRIGIRLRDMLGHLGLESFPKTSGGKGLHLLVPLNTAVTFDQSRAFAEALARIVERESPAQVTATMTKAKREGKVFIDWSQNHLHKTTACVYTLRAGDRPTVSAPISWEEAETAIKKGDASGLRFEADDVLARVARHGDLMEPLVKLKQKLPKGVAT